MLHKAEVAAVAALAEGLGADEVDVMQVDVVDDVAAAKHGSEAIQTPSGFVLETKRDDDWGQFFCESFAHLYSIFIAICAQASASAKA